MIPLEHGGPDGGATIVHDFSTNANPLGPPPEVATAIREAARGRYPDGHYLALRECLARWHGVTPARILPSAGTSEAIRRLTLAAFLQGIRTVWAPQPGYGDYPAAALALGMVVRPYADLADLLPGLGDTPTPALVWLCEPCNPTGQSLAPARWSELLNATAQSRPLLVLDRAYEPLRLTGECPVPAGLLQRAWQCHSPNKALGLTGVRAGYLLAPIDEVPGLSARMGSLAPSWVLSAEGVALLGALPAEQTQAWLARSRVQLRQWMTDQRAALAALGWQQLASVANFWLARPAEQGAALRQRLTRVRDQGIKLRDATSFGLPGWVRVSVQAPAARQALVDAWRAA